jgi:hypothetical protein
LRDLFERLTEGSSASLVACGRRDLPAASDVEHEDEVHVHTQGQRRVAPGEPARGDEHVVNGGDAETAELLGDRRGEVAALLDGSEAVEREAPVTVVVGGTRGYLARECLGERNQARAGVCSSCQL